MPEMYARPELLISARQLPTLLKNPKTRLIDLRSAADYAAGHLPGAVSMEEALLRADGNRETYLPATDALEALLRAAGVGPQTHIVAYDNDSRASARLWYVLNLHGVARVSLLHGGVAAWKRAMGNLDMQTPAPVPGDLRLRRRPGGGFFCPTSKVLAARRGVVLLDARSPEEFRGEGASKGRLPGATHIDWRENLDAEGVFFKSQSALVRLYREKGVTPDKEIVTYCGSGGRAAVSLFALTLIGYRKVRLYYGSYTDYSARPNVPFERG